MANVRLPAQGWRTRLGLQSKPCTLSSRKRLRNGPGPRLKLHRLHKHRLHGHKLLTLTRQQRHRTSHSTTARSTTFALKAAKRALQAAKRALQAGKRATARQVNGQRPIPATVA